MIHLWWICCKTVRTNARRQTSKWKARNDIENCDQRLNQINFDHYSWGLLFLDLHECVTVCRSSNKPTQRWLLSSDCCVWMKVYFTLYILCSIYVHAFAYSSVKKPYTATNGWPYNSVYSNSFFLFFTDLKFFCCCCFCFIFPFQVKSSFMWWSVPCHVNVLALKTNITGSVA